MSYEYVHHFQISMRISQIWQLASFSLWLGAAAVENNIDVVDTRIGTGGLGWGVGGQNPGAQIPFGACRVGPDTSTLMNVNLYQLGVHYGGYWYQDTHVRAFSHTHLVGM